MTIDEAFLNKIKRHLKEGKFPVAYWVVLALIEEIERLRGKDGIG